MISPYGCVTQAAWRYPCGRSRESDWSGVLGSQQIPPLDPRRSTCASAFAWQRAAACWWQRSACSARQPPPAPAPASPVVGYTYVNDNTAAANTIAGFDRHADGSLTPIPGSPFAAGGAGLGAGLASQGAIQVTSDGRYLLAVDAGSNQISVLRVTADGVPVLVGQPVSSGGIKPVSVAVSPTGLVYVANSGAGGSGYSGFRLHLDGSADPDPGLDGHRP